MRSPEPKLMALHAYNLPSHVISVWDARQCLVLFIYAAFRRCQVRGRPENQCGQPAAVHLVIPSRFKIQSFEKLSELTQPESVPNDHRLISNPLDAAWPYTTVEGLHGNDFPLIFSSQAFLSNPAQCPMASFQISDHGVPLFALFVTV